MMTINTNTLHPHPLISLLPLAVLIALIALVLRIFPDDALSGASQVALMWPRRCAWPYRCWCTKQSGPCLRR